jgi:glutamine cyclotransferase
MERPAKLRWCWWALPIALAVAAVFAWPFQKVPRAQDPQPPVWGCRVVETYPHDRQAFTQGLAFADGLLYEGTGQFQRSSLRRVDLKTGRVLQMTPLNPRLFGEGITILGDKIYQLTWRSGMGLVFDRKSLKYLGSFRYQGEGWGLTHDGTHLILSDGTATLRFLDPASFKVVKQMQVRSQGRNVENLNELEYVIGEIYANIWHADHVARISPETGEVLGWIDLSGLLKPHERIDPEAVLNGIAYDEKAGRLFVTGKHWPKLFEIKTVAPGR